MEWTVFQVVAALAALFLSLGVPIIQLNGTITRLNVTLERTEKDVLQQKKELERQKAAASALGDDRMDGWEELNHVFLETLEMLD